MKIKHSQCGHWRICDYHYAKETKEMMAAKEWLIANCEKFAAQEIGDMHVALVAYIAGLGFKSTISVDIQATAVYLVTKEVSALQICVSYDTARYEHVLVMGTHGAYRQRRKIPCRRIHMAISQPIDFCRTWYRSNASEAQKQILNSIQQKHRSIQ